MCIARAEAAAAARAGGGAPSETDKLKAALLLAVHEKQVTDLTPAIVLQGATS